MGGHLPDHLEVLLAVLAEPKRADRLAPREWDRLLRVARSARLLGTLASRIRSAEPAVEVPDVAQRHLDGALLEARFRRQKMLYLLDSIAPLVAANASTCVLLKGAAYAMQGLPIAAGRLPADVDVMVPRDRLDAAEAALLAAGWEFEKTDPYDQHYYRAWSHELPPMKCAGQALELDVHHTILPPLGRLRPDPALLFADAVPIDGSPYRALSRTDQLLHAAAHLFQDSDCTNRLRDLVDFDDLLRSTCPPKADFGDHAHRIVGRAEELELVRPLAYAAAFAHAWCDTPGAEEISDVATRHAGGRRSSVFVSLVCRTLGPPDPDRLPSAGRRWSKRLLEARAAWLRMPFWLVAYHAVAKLQQALLAKLRPSMRDAG